MFVAPAQDIITTRSRAVAIEEVAMADDLIDRGCANREDIPDWAVGGAE
jgi:hypothetical protein